MNTEIDVSRQTLRTPRVAAISSIVFSVLLVTSIVLVRLVLPSIPIGAAAWAADSQLRTSLLIAANLVPFASIAFIWFIGAVRDRLGQREDRFFSTVILGSGLLFVAMLCAETAMAAGLITSPATASSNLQSSDAWRIAHAVTYTLITTYSMRMAAVFTIASATITLQIAIMPRWLALLGYACAIALLLSVGVIPWIEFLFPIWILCVSMEILLATLRTPD